MATTYRTPVYGLAKYLKKMLLYESKTNPGTRFEFNVSSSYTDKVSFNTTYYFECAACYQIQQSIPEPGRKIPKISSTV